MIENIEEKWSRELRAEVEIRPNVWEKYRTFEVYVDGHDAFTASSVAEAERFLETLSMVTEREVDGY